MKCKEISVKEDENVSKRYWLGVTKTCDQDKDPASQKHAIKIKIPWSDVVLVYKFILP